MYLIGLKHIEAAIKIDWSGRTSTAISVTYSVSRTAITILTERAIVITLPDIFFPYDASERLLPFQSNFAQSGSQNVALTHWSLKRGAKVVSSLLSRGHSISHCGPSTDCELISFLYAVQSIVPAS